MALVVKCSEILAHIELRNNPRVNKVFTFTYTTYKTRNNPSDDTLCRLCGEAVESLEYVLAGCLALAQSKYLARHRPYSKNGGHAEQPRF